VRKILIYITMDFYLCIILDTFRDEAISFGFDIEELSLNIDFEEELMELLKKRF